MSHDVSLQLYDRNGQLVGALPDAATWSASFELSDVGALSFEYPDDGVNADQLLDFAEVALVDRHGSEYQGGRYVILATDRDRLAELEPRKYVAKSLLWRLSTALVYPEGGASSPALSRSMTGTPGAIMAKLIDEAHARGALAGITYDFSAGADSAGIAWPGGTVTTEVKPGANLLAVARYFIDNGLIEFATEGRVIRGFRGDGLGADLSQLDPPTILRHGQGLTEAPEKLSAERVAGVVLVVGDEGAASERTNPIPTVQYGRIETSVGASGVTDVGTLGIIGEASLLTASTPAREITVGIAVDSDGPVPLRDFEVGDWLWTQTGAEAPERVRVRNAVVERGSDGDSSSAVLGDRLYEQEVKIARQIEALTGGARSSGNTDTPDTTQPPTASDPFAGDGTFGTGLEAPSTPTATARLGTVTLTWDGKNSSGGPMPVDFDHVEVHMGSSSGFTPTSATVVDTIPLGGHLSVIDGLPYNVVRYFVLVAVDRGGDHSAPSGEVSCSVKPLVNADLIGQVIANANFMGGAVDARALASGAVDATKLAIDAVGPGTIQANAVVAGKIAANAIGAREIAANSIVAGHIVAGQITSEKIAALAIDADKIQANAITADKLAVGAIDASKITAGTMSGDRITGGTISGTTISGGVLVGATLRAGWTANDYAFQIDPSGFINARNATGQSSLYVSTWDQGGNNYISTSGHVIKRFRLMDSAGNLIAWSNEGSSTLWTNGISAQGNIASSTRIDAPYLQSNGNGYVAGTLTVGALGSGGNLSSYGIYENGGGLHGTHLYLSNGATITGETLGNTIIGNVQVMAQSGDLRVPNAPTTGAGTNAWISIGSDPGRFYRNTSSLRYKQDVELYDRAATELLELEPKWYRDKGEVERGVAVDGSETAGPRRYAGLIAEEVHELGLREFVAYNEKDEPETVLYDRLSVGLLAIVRAQQEAIAALTTRVEALESSG